MTGRRKKSYFLAGKKRRYVSPQHTVAFTLIERVSRLSLRWCSLLKDRPYQSPIQVGSLTSSGEEQSSMLMRGDSQEGNLFSLWLVVGWLTEALVSEEKKRQLSASYGGKAKR